MGFFEGGVRLELHMSHLSGFVRDRLPLLPVAADDYANADKPVPFIDAFAEGLDLEAACFIRKWDRIGKPGQTREAPSATEAEVYSALTRQQRAKECWEYVRTLRAGEGS